MKKLIFSLMAVAAFFAGCNVVELNDESAPETKGETLIINASLGTKTSMSTSDYTVAWEESENLSVVAKYSDGTYSGYQFTKGEGNKFSGEVTNLAGITEIYVVYPYDSGMNSINTAYGSLNRYITVGAGSSSTQVQAKAGDASHIKGNLFGTSTVSEGVANVTMQHLTTLFEINLTNNSGADLTVSNITLTNSENADMTGSFYVYPADAHLSASSATYTKTSASLDVTDGTLAAGATGKFYITSAPFELPADGKLTVTVTMSDYSTCVIEKTATAVTSFAAGTYNQINATIEAVQEVEPVTDGEYLIIAYSSNAWHLMSGTFASNRYSSLASTATGAFADLTCKDFYTTEGIENCVWKITGVENGYNIQNAVTNNYVGLQSSAGSAASSAEPVLLTILPNIDTEGSHVIKQPGVTINTVDAELMKNNNSPYFTSYAGTQSDIYLLAWTPDDTPRIFVSETSQTVDYSVTEATFSYSTRNIEGDLTVTETDTDNIIESVTAVDGKVTVTLAANTEEREKTATVTLSFTGAESVVLTVNQNAAPGANAKYYVKVTENLSDWSGTYLLVCDVVESPVAFTGSLSGTSTKYGLSETISVETIAAETTTTSIKRIMSNSTTSSYEVTITKDASSGNYTMNCSAGYLFWKTGNSLNASSSIPADDNGYYWTLSYDEASTPKLSLTNVSDSTRRIWYNAGNASTVPRFACYNSTSQNQISLYKLEE